MAVPGTSLYAVQNNTQCEVTFYTHDTVNNRFAVWDETIAKPKLRGPVFQWEYQDTVNQAAAAVSFSMKSKGVRGLDPLMLRGKPWPDVIQEGDWWNLTVTKNGKKHRLGFGRIDAINVNIGVDGSGSPHTQVGVQGRSFGWAMNDVPVYFNRFDATLNNALGVNMLAAVDQITGAPHELITSMIEALMSAPQNTAFLVPGAPKGFIGGYIVLPPGMARTPDGPATWIQMFDLVKKVQPTRGQAIAAKSFEADDAGALWGWLNAWLNPSLNEMFVDTDPDPNRLKAYLVIREHPFENLVDGVGSPWFALTEYEVDARTIKNLDLTRGQNRRNSIVLLEDLNPLLNSDTYGISTPSTNLSSIEKHGLRRLEETTPFFDNEGAASGSEGVVWNSLIRSWNALNHRYWNGQLSFGEMLPHIRKGTKIAMINGPLGGYKVFPKDIPGDKLSRMTFYVEGVRHAWSEGVQPQASTDLTVTRGYKEGDRLTDLAREIADFTTLAGSPGGSINFPGDLNIVDVPDPNTGTA